VSHVTNATSRDDAAAVGRRRRLVLIATVLGSSMAFVDATVVNVALPTIGRDLDLGLAGRQWVFLAYSLPLASLYLPAGGIADRLGRRRMFLVGTVTFAVASLIAGAAPGAAVLLAARGLQGAAGAFLAVASLSLLRATYGEESGRAVGLWSAWSGIATIVGPPLGGALTQWVSWRLVFLINLPFAVGAYVLAARATDPEPRRPIELGKLDLPGGALLTVAFATLTYALTEKAYWLLAVAVVSLAAAIWRERRTDDPMLPLDIFRDRSFAAAAVETFLVYAALAGATFFLVLYLQSVVGLSPLQSSLPTLPISFVLLLLAGRFGALSDAHGPRLYLTVGPALLAVGMLLWAVVTRQGQWWLLAVGSFVFALGLAMIVAPITSAALSNAPERLAGAAAGVSNTMARVGGLFAVSLVGLVVQLAYSGPGTPLTSSGRHDPSVHAFRAAMVVSAALAAAGSLVALVGFASRTSRGSRSGSAGSRSRPGAGPGPASGRP
jgi:EmrB/QacA subfamily drug resistance transporter